MRLIFPSLVSLWSVSSLGAVDLVLGHFEYQIDYTVPVAGSMNDGWRSSISYDPDGSFADDEGVVRMPLENVRLLAAPSTRLVSSGPLPAFGIGANEPLWIFSQNNIPGQLFLGWRAIYPQGIFQAKIGGNYSPSPLGAIEASLLEVAGSGPERGGDFFMWTSSGFGSLEFHYNTSDGITSADVLSPIPSGSHSHYNWGFTHPGTYEVRFRNEAKFNPGQPFANQVTESEAILSFVVPHEGVLTGTGQWRLGAGASGAPSASVYDPAGEVDYAVDQVVLITDGREFAMRPAEAASVGQVGLTGVGEIEFPGEGLVSLSLRSHSGPGNVVMSQEGEETRFEFGSDGIYRVRLQAEQGGLVGVPFTLTFLVDLDADYSYADWADSFERTHGLAAGTLSDHTADEDRDGASNGLEFLLFWHGLDPAVSDCGRLPKPRYVDGRAEIEFLRDLRKDDFATSSLELAAAYSAKLQAPWRPWRRLFAEGAADGFYEDGAERGNETSVVMRRKLVVPEASANFGFFRFEQRLRN
jgi:surface-anchored protein